MGEKLESEMPVAAATLCSASEYRGRSTMATGAKARSGARTVESPSKNQSALPMPKPWK